MYEAMWEIIFLSVAILCYNVTK